MSADNCVAIGSFPTADGGKEYRVIHAQAIENCDDDNHWPQELTDATRVLYYDRSAVYATEAAAFAQAKFLYDEIMADDFCPICEYGIVSIAYDRQYPSMTKEEASKFSDDFWKERTHNV